MSKRPPLEQRLRETIERDGPITFAAFMEAALYDPDHGYYAEPPVGEGGDFVTSPHVSQAFGVLLARCVEDLWVRLGRPDRFDVIEIGAGDGTLARRLLASLPAGAARATTYVAVERSAGARDRLESMARELAPALLVKVLDELPASAERPAGVVLANEVLDNLPFHRIRGTEAGTVELRVDISPDGFELAETPLSPELAERAPALAPGEEAIVSLAAEALLEQAANAISRGHLLFFDYANEGPQPPGGIVHGYRRHRVEPDVLATPGSRDVTAGVDVGALVRRADELGLQVWGPITQREALLNLGLREWERALRAKQAAALNEGRGREASRIYSARNRARLLVDSNGLGRFFVLCIGVGDAPRPGLLLDGEK